MSRTIKKPSFMFVFTDEQSANRFYGFASSQSTATLVQHPYNYDGRGARDTKRVLVTGVGSDFFDSVLRYDLIQFAEKFGGYCTADLESECSK